MINKFDVIAFLIGFTISITTTFFVVNLFLYDCSCNNSFSDPVVMNVEFDDLYVNFDGINNPNATMYTRNSDGDFEVWDYES